MLVDGINPINHFRELNQKKILEDNSNLQNIFNEHELDKSVVCAEIAHTTKHGAIENKTQTTT